MAEAVYVAPRARQQRRAGRPTMGVVQGQKFAERPPLVLQAGAEKVHTNFTAAPNGGAGSRFVSSARFGVWFIQLQSVRRTILSPEISTTETLRNLSSLPAFRSGDFVLLCAR